MDKLLILALLAAAWALGLDLTAAMPLMFLVGKTTVESNVPEPSAEERALTAKQVELAEFQLEELRAQRTDQAAFAQEIAPFLEAQTAEAERQAGRARLLEPIQDEILQIQLEDLRRGGAASPEQQALIEEAGAAAIEQGGTDIERFRTESLEALREELAPALGLRSTDTPILDRGARVAAEATRQGGQLSARIAEAVASGKVNLGLAGSQLTQSAGLGLAQVTEATRQFQESLRQQAFTNRLNVSGQAAGIGLGLAGSPARTLGLAQQSLQDDRFARASTTTSGLGQFLGPGIGAAGAIGAALVTPSSERFKTDIEEIEDAEALEAIHRLPVKRWRYREGLGLADGKTHIGPMAESMRGLGLSDGDTINIGDVAGLGLAASKAVAKRLDRIERGLGLAEAA